MWEVRLAVGGETASERFLGTQFVVDHCAGVLMISGPFQLKGDFKKCLVFKICA